MGMIPARLTSPTVGLRPTTPFSDDGQMIDPFVSVPIDAAQKFADVAAAEPDEEPHGLRSIANALPHCPPRPLHPELERVDRKFAHSDRFAFARRMAPAARNFSAT